MNRRSLALLPSLCLAVASCSGGLGPYLDSLDADDTAWHDIQFSSAESLAEAFSVFAQNNDVEFAVPSMQHSGTIFERYILQLDCGDEDFSNLDKVFASSRAIYEARVYSDVSYELNYLIRTYSLPIQGEAVAGGLLDLECLESGQDNAVHYDYYRAYGDGVSAFDAVVYSYEGDDLGSVVDTLANQWFILQR